MKTNTVTNATNRTLVITALVFFISLFSAGQTMGQTNTVPCGALPFCSDSTYVFPNNTTGFAPIGLQYACNLAQPCPSFYYMQIATAGTIQLEIEQTTATGGQLDIDFTMWGPFTSLTEGCDSINNGAEPIQSSFSTANIETVGIGLQGGAASLPGVAGCLTTPPPAQVGEVYIILMTNFDQLPGTITFSQTGGTGSADCGIVSCGLSTTSDGSVCAGTDFHLGAENLDTSYTYTYHWTGPFGLSSDSQNPTFSIDQAGTYTFEVRSISNTGDTCFQNASITILPAQVYEQSVAICSGETYNFFGREYTVTGVYDTVFSTVNGCDSIIQLNLTVNPLPDVTLDHARDVDLCTGDTARLRLANPDAANSYQWYYNGLPSLTDTGYQIYATATGTYSVRATTSQGCSAMSELIRVTLHDPPVAEIQPIDPGIPCAFDTLSFAAKQGEGYDYFWTPEENFRYWGGPHGPEVHGVFAQSTAIELRVRDQFGCEAIDAAYVTVQPCCNVFIPSAFTPNNDGNNDVFKPHLQPSQILLNLKIYNRLGQLIYETDKQGSGWNGKFPNGEDAPTDTYMYIVDYTCADGKVYQKKESLTLVR